MVNFQLVAYTDAAGKYTPGAYLNGNEDNFYIDDDLRDSVPCSTKPGEIVNLSDEGMIMVVADGMGGMNAGEVASEIAVNTVKEYFTSAKITADQSSTYEKRREYLENVIKDCDYRIKADAKCNPDHKGMGSTIILAWMAHGEITISWLGDSRAYRYNPAYGIQILSKDHSYVQELVDKNVITYEQSFDHPQGNIVTRSLGDTSNKPQPETRNYTVAQDDLFLLCSDGLSGVLRDRKVTDSSTGLPYPEENIEDVIAANYADISRCREALFEAAKRGDWYDNVTVVLCKIVSLGDTSLLKEKQDHIVNSMVLQSNTTEVDPSAEESHREIITNVTKSIHLRINGKGVAYVMIAILVIIAAIVGAVYFLMNMGMVGQQDKVKSDTIKVDTTQVKETTPPPVVVSEDENKEKTQDKADDKKGPLPPTGKKSEQRTNAKDLLKKEQQERLKTVPSIPAEALTGITSSEDPEHSENNSQNNP